MTTTAAGLIEAAHGVKLGDRTIGTLLQRGDVARFEFADGYWDDPDRPVLGMWFEDNPGQSPQAALRLPPWFSNLLPEGKLREWIAAERGVKVDRELQLLLQIGADLPGAIEVVPFDGDLADLDSLTATGLSGAPGAHLDNLWRFSLAGVGMKFSLLRDGDRLTVPAHHQLGDWIVKLPDRNFENLPATEYATMQFAEAVGIDTPEIELISRDALPTLPGDLWPGDETVAFGIKRFDRTAHGKRIHIEDFAQVRGFYPDRKYDGTLETVMAIAFRGRDRRSLQEAVRRATFNLLIGNGDAHLKNWSLIYVDGRIPSLSPAYDLVCTAPYLREGASADIGLKFGGVRQFDRVSRVAFEQLQTRLSVDRSDVLDIVDATIESFFEHLDGEWRQNSLARIAAWVDGHADAMRQRLSGR